MLNDPLLRLISTKTINPCMYMQTHTLTVVQMGWLYPLSIFEQIAMFALNIYACYVVYKMLLVL